MAEVFQRGAIDAGAGENTRAAPDRLRVPGPGPRSTPNPAPCVPRTALRRCRFGGPLDGEEISARLAKRDHADGS
jgi:hypothetical protein